MALRDYLNSPFLSLSLFVLHRFRHKRDEEVTVAAVISIRFRCSLNEMQATLCVQVLLQLAELNENERLEEKNNTSVRHELGIHDAGP